MKPTGKPLNLVGQRFGRWVVLEQAESQHKKTMWRCRCDCGTERIVCGTNLVQGISKSCGCLNRERTIERNIANTKHHTKSNRLYRIYYGILTRCLNEKSPNYQLYGAKGVTVCKEWKDNYEAFKEWSLKNGYRDDLTIDRINPKGDYEPSNCRWATPKEQATNRSNVKLYTYNGKTLCISDWAKEFGIKYITLYQRLKKGIPFEEAILVTK